MKIKLIMLVSLIAIGFAASATAGTVADADLDGVPDSFDNCLNVANGPSLGACNSQQNADGDSFGDACDGDYVDGLGAAPGDGFVTGTDFSPWFAAFTLGTPILGDEDMDCDGFVTGTDFGPWFVQFTLGTPGP